VLSVHSLPASRPVDLEAIAGIFDLYRRHYGQAAEPDRSASWLADQLEVGRLSVFVAEQNSAIVGFATSVQIPASLQLGHWWQIRDLFVLPDHRRQGIALALLDAVRSAAEASGALRVGLQTEEENEAALALYRGAGYLTVTGYRGLVLSLGAT
jgi:ribosomal protein S18 acetylase RimI-like enzyme